MKFSVSKESMLSALQMALGVVNPRTTLPILSNVLIRGEGKTLSLTATDLDLSVRCGIDAEIEQSGDITLPARRLLNIVRELATDQIAIEVGDDNRATLQCGSSVFRIVGMAGEDFPPLPRLEGGNAYSINQGILKSMLEKIAYAASTEDTRQILNGVLMKFEDQKLVLVATDGRRLALIESEVEFPKETQNEFVVPSKTINELTRVLQDDGIARLHVVKKQVAFEFGETVVLSKLIEGNYPNFRQVIPSESDKRIAIDREALLTALKRVSLVTTERGGSVKLSFTRNQLEVSVETPDVGEARETLAVKYAGAEVTVAFNPEFLMAPLRILPSDEVYLELSDGLSPGVLKCDLPFLYVLMPIRVT